MKLRKIFEGYDIPIPDNIIVTLEPHAYQLEDLHKFCRWKRSNNFSEVGTGKSLVSYLWIMHKLYQGHKTLVVMPPPLIPQYLRNFSVIEGHSFIVATLNPSRSKRLEEFYGWSNKGFPDVLVMSYQMFVKHHKVFSGHYGALIADEVHTASNVSTKYFQAMFCEVHTQGMYFMGMTATPCMTELRNAYSFIKMVSPDTYRDMAHFDRLHTVYVPGDWGGKQIVGYQNEPAIAEGLERNSVRRRQREVLTMTKPTIVDLWVSLSDDHMALYQQLLIEQFIEMGDNLLVANNAQALRQMALQMVTNMSNFTEKPFEDNPLETLKLVVGQLPPNKKIAVFCNFRETVLKLSSVFKHMNPAIVYGGSNVPQNVDKFLNEGDCKIIILNYQSGGAGFNLQGVCHHVVFFESCGSPGALTQALGRVDRQGQKEPVLAWVFRYTQTLSEELFKKAFNRFPGMKLVMQDTTSFLDYLV